MIRPSPYDTFINIALHNIDKSILYALCWSSTRPIQERIDEEGCGAVMAAAKYLKERS